MIIAAFLLRPRFSLYRAKGSRAKNRHLVRMRKGTGRRRRRKREGRRDWTGRSVVVSACTRCRKRDPWIIVFAAGRERRDRNGGHKSLERLSLNVIGSRPIGVVRRPVPRRRKFSPPRVEIEWRPGALAGARDFSKEIGPPLCTHTSATA